MRFRRYTGLGDRDSTSRMSATLEGHEPSFASRRHLGGSLHLGYDTQQSGPHENSLEQQFRQNSRQEDDYNTHYDSHRVLSTSAADFNGDPRTLRPEVDRSALRRIMLDALPPEPAECGHALSSVQLTCGPSRSRKFGSFAMDGV